MHLSMENRGRQASLKTSLPDPLVLKQEPREQYYTYLQTPPPTGSQTATRDVFDLRIGAATRSMMPYTPTTPHMLRHCAKDSSSDVVTLLAKRQPVDAEAAVRAIPLAAAKRPRAEACSTTQPGSAETAGPPRKRQITEADLISDPFRELAQAGTPACYIRQILPRVAARRMRVLEGATCTIRCVKQTKAGSVRVKITPNCDDTASFHMVCKQGSEDRDCRPSLDTVVEENDTDEKARDNGDDEEGEEQDDEGQRSTETDSFAASPPMPLHVEVALARAPLLGKLLLSGHVFRGDQIEIELPHPEVFPDVLRWMYTGRAEPAKRKRIDRCLTILHAC